MSTETDKHASMDAKWDDFRGRVKEAAGALFDDEDTRREGRIEQKGAEAKDHLERFVDGVTDSAKSLFTDRERTGPDAR